MLCKHVSVSPKTNKFISHLLEDTPDDLLTCAPASVCVRERLLVFLIKTVFFLMKVDF